jgi:xeroderma pigmentosum group C-complementing protein
MRVCKRLQIDYAEAVVDFEFGHRMAVPVIQGVVIAEENHETVMAELKKDEAERVRKEDEKRRKAALSQWRRFLMGMRIAERIRQEYGEIDDQVLVFGHARDATSIRKQPQVHDEEMAGGFLPEGYEEEEEEVEEPAHHTSAFFPAVDEDDEEDGGLVMEVDGQEQVDAEPEPVDPEPAEKESSEPQEPEAPQPQPEIEVESEADSEPPQPARRSRGRPRKQVEKKQVSSRPATRRSTRSGRKVVSYDEEGEGEGDDDEVADSYAESEDDE